MFNVEKTANYFAASVASILNFDKDYEEVLAYGAFTILHTLWSIVLTVVLAIIFNVPLEAIIVSCSASILRKNSGGVHASTSNRCAIIAAIVFVGISIFINQLIRYSLATIVLYCGCCFFISYNIIYKEAPKDGPNKPITNEAIKKYLRNNAIKTIHYFLLITITLLFLHLKFENKYFLISTLAIVTGTLWQSITLTKLGELIISSIDDLLGKISCFKGGEKL